MGHETTFPVPPLPVMNTFSPLSTTACILVFCSAERFAADDMAGASRTCPSLTTSAGPRGATAFAGTTPQARGVHRRHKPCAGRTPASAATILSNAAAPLSNSAEYCNTMVCSGVVAWYSVALFVPCNAARRVLGAWLRHTTCDDVRRRRRRRRLLPFAVTTNQLMYPSVESVNASRTKC